MTRPFRFGVQAGTAVSRDEWVAQAYGAERWGYATLNLPDHFGSQLAPTPALAVAAEATLTLRIGCFVYANDYHHPVVLAKEAATLDLLAGGRLELGLGAGWLRHEYEQAGIPFDRAGVRIERLAESIAVLKGLFAPGSFSFAGRYYQVDQLDGLPKPLQAPHPPLLIGGGGQRLLTLAAREANIVSFNPRALPDGTLDMRDTLPEAVAEKISWVRDAAGDRFDDLELNTTLLGIAVTGDRLAAAERLGARLRTAGDLALRSPLALAGTVDDMVEELQARRDRFGISYFMVRRADMEAFAPVVARLAGR